MLGMQYPRNAEHEVSERRHKTRSLNATASEKFNVYNFNKASLITGKVIT
jgi:hypothetical protein